jgi:hypothetical protein
MSPARLLPALLLAVTVATAAEPSAFPDPAALRARLESAVAVAAWDSAVAPAERLVVLAQNDNFETLYVLLRVYCQQGDRTSAYQALEMLLDAGWSDYQRLRQDTDLALINQEDRCRTTVRRSWSRQYIRMLERDNRDEMQKPAEIMAALHHTTSCPSSTSSSTRRSSHADGRVRRRELAIHADQRRSSTRRVS